MSESVGTPTCHRTVTSWSRRRVNPARRAQTRRLAGAVDVADRHPVQRRIGVDRRGRPIGVGVDHRAEHIAGVGDGLTGLATDAVMAMSYISV